MSLASAGGADAWVLYFTDAACGACKAAYPAVKAAAEVLPIVAVATGLDSEGSFFTRTSS